MKRAMYSILALLMFVLLSLPIYAESSEKNIVSRTAEIDGQQLHYLFAGHGPAVLCCTASRKLRECGGRSSRYWQRNSL